MDRKAMYKLSYGLFILTAKEAEKDNGCIINTAIQAASEPNQLSICVNKANYTHDMIQRTGKFTVSVLSQKAQFELFKHFGFQSGRDTNKFEAFEQCARGTNGIYYITEGTNAYISVTVTKTEDLGSHTMFIGEITDMEVLSNVPSVTYDYYQNNIKPKPQEVGKTEDSQTIWRCRICGYEYVGEELPDDFICPLCKHPASDFEKVVKKTEVKEMAANKYAGTQTEKNLQEAFAGESQARNKYTYFASVAKKEGYIPDDWDKQYNVGLYEETYDEAVRFAKAFPETAWCYGNHDLSYLWHCLESGYSSMASMTVQRKLLDLREAVPEDNPIKYVQRIDNVLFSHGGVLNFFVEEYVPRAKYNDVDAVLETINQLGRIEMWNDASPIWLRPQHSKMRLYKPRKLLQVVGHTPMDAITKEGNLISTDVFSTYRDGKPIGTEEFLLLDTVTWEYCGIKM